MAKKVRVIVKVTWTATVRPIPPKSGKPRRLARFVMQTPYPKIDMVCKT